MNQLKVKWIFRLFDYGLPKPASHQYLLDELPLINICRNAGNSNEFSEERIIRFLVKEGEKMDVR